MPHAARQFLNIREAPVLRRRDLHVGALDSGAVQALMEVRIDAVAMGFGVTPAGLQRRSLNSDRTHARRLAFALCFSVAGVDRRALAGWFGIRESSFGNMEYKLKLDLAVDADLRKRVETICAKLGLPVPGSAEESAWPVPLIADIWDAVAGYGEITGEQLRASYRVPEFDPWRALAADICLRRPEITQVGLMQGYGHNHAWLDGMRARLPWYLTETARLREADRVVSVRFGVAFRKESREPVEG